MLRVVLRLETTEAELVAIKTHVCTVIPEARKHVVFTREAPHDPFYR